jgi:hypothetical protein
MLTRFALVAVLVFALGGLGASAQNGVGKKFGARDPRACGSTKEPGRGGPSADQAKQYFICGFEGINHFGSLKLVDAVSVEVGKGRPFNRTTDSTSDIDPSQTVFPIRGGFTLWVCEERARVTGDPNKNCTREAFTKNTGICYKDTFGDWHCELDYSPNFRETDHNMPPPR